MYGQNVDLQPSGGGGGRTTPPTPPGYGPVQNRGTDISKKIVFFRISNILATMAHAQLIFLTVIKTL